jgi:hypothetical protein
LTGVWYQSGLGIQFNLTSGPSSRERSDAKAKALLKADDRNSQLQGLIL